MKNNNEKTAPIWIMNMPENDVKKLIAEYTQCLEDYMELSANLGKKDFWDFFKENYDLLKDFAELSLDEITPSVRNYVRGIMKDSGKLISTLFYESNFNTSVLHQFTSYSNLMYGQSIVFDSADNSKAIAPVWIMTMPVEEVKDTVLNYLRIVDDYPQECCEKDDEQETIGNFFDTSYCLLQKYLSYSVDSFSPTVRSEISLLIKYTERVASVFCERNLMVA